MRERRGRLWPPLPRKRNLTQTIPPVTPQPLAASGKEVPSGASLASSGRSASPARAEPPAGKNAGRISTHGSRKGQRPNEQMELRPAQSSILSVPGGKFESTNAAEKKGLCGPKIPAHKNQPSQKPTQIECHCEKGLALQSLCASPWAAPPFSCGFSPWSKPWFSSAAGLLCGSWGFEKI